MKNSDKPAYPDPMRGSEQSYSNQSPQDLPQGLTKREMFAMAAMQGILANINLVNIDPVEISHTGIRCADELLKQLDTNP